MNLFLHLFLALFSISFAILRPESDLTSHCYHFPAKDFGKVNNVKKTYGSSPQLILNVDDDAIDFTLYTPEGISQTLSDHLSKGPVLLIWGHYTCPAFQGFHSDTMFIGSSYSEEYDMVEALKGKVKVLHLVGPEPHPMWPYSNFDSGSLKMNYWSVIKQPQSYEERLNLSVPLVQPLLHPEAVLLVESLEGRTGLRNNPVWCSYAHAARACFLIDQEGRVRAAQDWYSKEQMMDSVKDAFPSLFDESESSSSSPSSPAIGIGSSSSSSSTSSTSYSPVPTPSPTFSSLTSMFLAPFSLAHDNPPTPTSSPDPSPSTPHSSSLLSPSSVWSVPSGSRPSALSPLSGSIGGGGGGGGGMSGGGGVSSGTEAGAGGRTGVGSASGGIGGGVAGGSTGSGRGGGGGLGGGGLGGSGSSSGTRGGGMSGVGGGGGGGLE